VEFLVEITIELPALDDAATAELLSREALRGRELIDAGKLRRIWRLPGQRANISLYEVRDATELHELLGSLPLWPYLKCTVRALAMHPLEQ
jgi:muconolactone D-isomerase